MSKDCPFSVKLVTFSTIFLCQMTQNRQTPPLKAPAQLLPLLKRPVASFKKIDLKKTWAVILRLAAGAVQPDPFDPECLVMFSTTSLGHQRSVTKHLAKPEP